MRLLSLMVVVVILFVPALSAQEAATGLECQDFQMRESASPGLLDFAGGSDVSSMILLILIVMFLL